MLKIRSVAIWGVLATCLACGQGGSGVAEAGPEKLAPADLTLEELLANHLAARGGAEAIEGLRSVVKQGTMGTSDFVGKEVVAKVRVGERYIRRVDYDGQEIYSGFDGTKAWQKGSVPGVEGVQELSPKVSAVVRSELDLAGPLVDSQAKGHQLELLGRSRHGYKVRIVTPDGLDRNFYVDAETFQINRIREFREFSGTEFEVVVDFDRYQAVGGVQLAHLEELHIEAIDFDQLIKWDSIIANPDLPEEDFAPPAADLGETPEP
ncbi:MAG: hypothetical protein K0U98_12395 [Deltaproteobacteria bacterium]|nr:hypothetical protein [Deltaproteobacteria bacterium]